MRVCAALAVAALVLAFVSTAAHASPHARVQRHHPTHSAVPERKSFNGFWLTGLLPAAMTAFGADGALNLTAVPLQAAALKAQGVQYVFVGGTTSECLSLTTDERERLVEAWAKQLTPNGLQLVVHVGAEALRDAVRLAKHAVAHGAIAVAAFPPIYFKPSGLNALVATMAVVAAAVPDTPFIYYHFPAMTGSLVGTGIVPFVEAAASAIPNFHGVKFTDTNLLDAATIVRWTNPSNGQQYQVLLGKDEMMADGLLYGCDGFIGSTFGYAAPLYLRLIDAWRAGNTTAVQLEQTRAQQFIDVFSAYNAGDNIRGNKPLMGLKLGIDMGAPRLPQQPITAAELHDLQQQLQAIGFFQWSS